MPLRRDIWKRWESELGSNYVIEGAEDDNRVQEFINLWYAPERPDIPQAYYDKAEKEFVELAIEFYQSHPNMGANDVGMYRDAAFCPRHPAAY